MRKQDRKRDNAIRLALTRVCDKLLDTQVGFCWLTHTVNYQRFPQSLNIILVFENASQMRQCEAIAKDAISALITRHLNQEDIALPNAISHLHFDNEAACHAEHNGNWARRLSGC